MSREAKAGKAPAPLAVSVEEAALISGLGRTSIYGAVKSGALKARKAGRRTIVLKSDLQAWLAALPTIEPAEAA